MNTHKTKKLVYSDRLLDVMRFLYLYIDTHKYCPTFREIGVAISLDGKGTSTSVVHYYLHILHLRGMVDALFQGKGRMAFRTIHLTDKGNYYIRDLIVPSPVKKSVPIAQANSMK